MFVQNFIELSAAVHQLSTYRADKIGDASTDSNNYSRSTCSVSAHIFLEMQLIFARVNNM